MENYVTRQLSSPETLGIWGQHRDLELHIMLACEYIRLFAGGNIGSKQNPKYRLWNDMRAQKCLPALNYYAGISGWFSPYKLRTKRV